MFNKDYRPVDVAVLTLAAKTFFPQKEISLIDVPEIINWKVYEKAIEKTETGEEKPIPEGQCINLDIVLAEKMLRNFFDLPAVRIEYTGFIRGKIYFVS